MPQQVALPGLEPRESGAVRGRVEESAPAPQDDSGVCVGSASGAGAIKSPLSPDHCTIAPNTVLRALYEHAQACGLDGRHPVMQLAALALRDSTAAETSDVEAATINSLKGTKDEPRN